LVKTDFEIFSYIADIALTFKEVNSVNLSGLSSRNLPQSLSKESANQTDIKDHLFFSINTSINGAGNLEQTVKMLINS
jgi:hypothetical protein